MYLKNSKNPFKFLIVLAIACSILSCDDDKLQIPQSAVSYGSYVKVGNGQARSFIVKNQNGSAKEIGFNFTEEALEGLPEHNASFKLPMPADNKTLVNHISFDYSIHGHDPEGIYNVPHFDMHFNMLTEKEIDAITLEDPKIDILPPTKYIPLNYVPGANEPKMGKHWADTTAHEFHGANFTSTFIYGSYNGKFHFLEPMVAISYLKTKPNDSFDISQQAKVQQTGLYPEKYSIAWEKDRQEYRITLDNMTLRQQ